MINLSHRGLTIVTGRLAGAVSARNLLLNHNKLLVPPEEMCSLTNLTELVLDNNMLTMIPSGDRKLHLLICVGKKSFKVGKCLQKPREQS